MKILVIFKKNKFIKASSILKCGSTIKTCSLGNEGQCFSKNLENVGGKAQ